ncbi:unnamed protein product [Bursaphelenchus okinawaensis]|uniref:Amidohydrolase-related domain-containing protein n=1 Tax=Bursaphelenchus okinawaensis TaxID=465554 RepID=A0A811L2R9_9BILA|nr:unnamed protein product [Bursaphelenchus okinawaensis]CAG9115548.1 unnamed protein product [Bursaphelenchus okinawaensis]
MFPWLPFLSIPDVKSKKRRRLRSRHNSLTSVWLNTNSDVRVEYLLHVHAASASVTAASSAFNVNDLDDDIKIRVENAFGRAEGLENRPDEKDDQRENGQNKDSEELKASEDRLARESGHNLVENEPESEIERPERSDSAPLVHKVEEPPPKKTSLQSSRPHTPNSRASPSLSRPSSRPSSTQPPPQPRVRPNRNRMFETSSAMRDIFGGSSSPRAPRHTVASEGSPRRSENSPRPSDSTLRSTQSEASTPAVHQAESRLKSSETNPEISSINDRNTLQNATDVQNLNASQNIDQNTTKPDHFRRSNESFNDEHSVRSGVTSDSGIASCFQRIRTPPPSSSGPSEVARTNVLQNEGVQQGRWESAPSTSYSTTSSFYNVPNHDTAYENARRRANGRPPITSSFNIITHEPMGSRVNQPGPEIPIEPGFVFGAGPSTSSPRRRNDQIELGAPGPEMATDTEESASPETEFDRELDTRTADDGFGECVGKGESDSRRQSTGKGESDSRRESTGKGESDSRRESIERRESGRDSIGFERSNPERPERHNGYQRDRRPSSEHQNGDLNGSRNGAGGRAPTDDLALSQNTPYPVQHPLNHNAAAYPPSTVPHSNAPPTAAIAPTRRFDPHKPLGGGFGAAGGPLVNDENRAPTELLLQLRRFLLSTSEDGSGMASAASNGTGGAGANPLVIRGGQIVNDDSIFAADIYIEDGVIKQILPNLEIPEQAEIIEAAGKWILPAGIDVHTEFSAGLTPDEFLVNSKAALIGGTTTVIDVVLPGISERLSDAVERIKRLADQKALINVGLSLSLYKWNDEVKREVEQLVREKKINSFILEMQNDSELFEALNHLKALGALARIYPENKDIIGLLEKQNSNQTPAENYINSRPVQLEAERIHKLCVLSQLTNSPISILSTSSDEACRSVIQGKQSGASVFAEVPISTLAADLSIPTPSQSRIPIRKGDEHVKGALEILANGQLAVCVSGHRTPRQSGNRPPYGVISVGERLPALWERAVASGKLDLMRFVAVSSSNPAKLFNLYPKKGRIAVGADADLAIWNAHSSRTLGCRASGAADKSPFDGFAVHATVEATICNGTVLYKNGKIEAEKPVSQRFVPLLPEAPHVFSVVKLREKTFFLGLA